MRYERADTFLTFRMTVEHVVFAADADGEPFPPRAHVWAPVFQPLREFCVVWAFDRSGFEEGRKFFRKVFVRSEGVAGVRLNRSAGRYAGRGLAQIHKLDRLDSAQIRQNKERFKSPVRMFIDVKSDFCVSVYRQLAFLENSEKCDYMLSF